jgi:molybdopterin-guanine dinucleotide biosynthesis adapter protein
MNSYRSATVIGIAGFSGSGKTTLIEKLIPLLRLAGVKVSVIKHAHHQFDVDKPGKDSHRHREAGAHEVLVASGKRWALMHELRDEQEPSLSELIAKLALCDIVIVEGFKHDAIPKIEVNRKDAPERAKLFLSDTNVVAVATDERLDTPVPQLDLNQPQEVAAFVLRFHAESTKVKQA